MQRCLQLAANGIQGARPNPMVGAVIVANGRIIGEGYHVRYGEGHAEVNAFASIRHEDEALLPEATIINGRVYESLGLYLEVALIYLIFCTFLTFLQRKGEKRLSRYGGTKS